MADSFRIWQFASQREWNVTVDEIADATELHPVRVFKMCLHRQWTRRLVRHRRPNWNDTAFKRQAVRLDELRDLGLPVC